MITLLIGDDSRGILNYIKSRRSQYEANSVLDFNKGDIDSIGVMDLVSSSGIFSTKKLIILHPAKVDEIDFKPQDYEIIKNFIDVELVVDATKIIKTSKAYQTLKKQSNVKEFVLPRDYTGFNIIDALFIENNKSKALKLITNMQNIEEDFFVIVSGIHNALRNYMTLKNPDGATFKSIHPFVKKKTSQIKIDDKKIPQLYKDLVKLDKDLKSSKTKRLNLIQDFVIYSL